MGSTQRRTFSAYGLSLADLGGDVEIRVGGSQIELEVSGGAEGEAEEIARNAAVSGGTLKVKGRAQQGGTTVSSTMQIGGVTIRSGVSTVSGGVHINTGGAVYVNGKLVTPGGSAGEQNGLLRVVVTVPRGTDVTIDEGSSAQYRIGDTEGALSIDSSGSVTLSAGRVSSLAAEVSGSGQIGVAEVLGGSIELDLRGSGGVKVSRGNATKVTARVSGAANVEFGGTAETLKARVSGVGNVYVQRVTGDVSDKVTGVGSVRVGQRG
jgi:hypothetical protein